MRIFHSSDLASRSQHLEVLSSAAPSGRRDALSRKQTLLNVTSLLNATCREKERGGGGGKGSAE